MGHLWLQSLSADTATEGTNEGWGREGTARGEGNNDRGKRNKQNRPKVVDEGDTHTAEEERRAETETAAATQKRRPPGGVWGRAPANVLH